MAGEAQALEHAGEIGDGAFVLGRDAGPADELGGKLDRIERLVASERGRHQSRSNSLIEVLARVFSSTRLTITAQ